jgi:hypothetical protein
MQPRLLITGHSLGAGVAALLAFIMKPEYPTAQCFAYGVPGGLLDERSKKPLRFMIFFYINNVTVTSTMNDSFVPHLLLRNLLFDRTAKECSSFITGIILGGDMIPRTNIYTLDKLRSHVSIHLELPTILSFLSSSWTAAWKEK